MASDLKLLPSNLDLQMAHQEVPAKQDVAFRRSASGSGSGSVAFLQHQESSPSVSRMQQSMSCTTVELADRRPPWVGHWWKQASTDNDAIHPYLRHYFDRRGLETSYRTRPEIDETSPVYQYRTPRHKGFVYKAVTAPPLSIAGSEDDPFDIAHRCSGNIQWRDRCRMFGTDAKPKLATDQQIPWVSDHHILESDDNAGLNPIFRHYFEKPGIESSFRNRGRESGRPKPNVHRKRPCTAP